MKILIIRFSSIGDIVLTSPVIRCIKKQRPDAEIHYLTKHFYGEIIRNNPYISAQHLVKDNLHEILSQLKKEKFDFVVDLHNNIRSWRVKRTLGRRSNSVNKINFEKWLYVNARVNLMPTAHIVDRYLNTVRGLGVMNDGEGLDYFISAKEEIGAEQLPLTHLHGYLVMAIGAQHATKKLPLSKLKELVSLLHYPIILVGGKEDADAGEEILKTDPLKVFNGCGVFTINQSASLIRQSKLVITHDTGMMHIAAAYKKRVISVWGNTVPAFGMTPYYGSEEADSKRSRIVEVKGLYCRPCSKLGFEKCPQGHFRCMHNIDMHEITSAVNSF